MDIHLDTLGSRCRLRKPVPPVHAGLHDSRPCTGSFVGRAFRNALRFGGGD
jgi:hypothetical protein